MPMILTIEGLKDFLKFGSVTGATGTDPLLKTAKVMLFVNNISPTPDTVAADLTEASWTGYARSSTITWGLPIVSNDTQLPCILGNEKTFDVTTNTAPETAYGYAIVTTVSAVDHLLAVSPFDTPINPGPATQIAIVPRIGLDPEAVNPPGDVTFQ